MADQTVAASESTPTDAGAPANPPGGDAPAPVEVDSGAAATAPVAPSGEVQRRPNPAVMLRLERKERRALQAELEQLRTEYPAKVQELEAKLAKQAEEFEKFKRNPLVEGARGGLDAEQAIRDFVDAAAPEKLIAEQNRRIKELEERDSQREAKRLADEQERQEKARAQAEIVAVRGFVKFAGDNAKRYPHLNSELTADQIAAETHKIQEWAKSQKVRLPDGSVGGATYTFEQVAEFLEGEAKKLHTIRQQRRDELLRPAQAASTGNPTEQTNGRVRQTATARTTAVAPKQETAQVKRAPVRSRNLYDPDEVAADLALLKAATAKDAAAQNGKVAPKAPEKTNGKARV